MLFNYVVAILTSFLFTFAISIPFIKLLYKFNIRRLSESNLDEHLPERSSIKLGTPIMGGTVIIISIIVLGWILLSDWQFFPLVLVMSILGAIVGFYDEYTNALGRTFKAIRFVRSKKAGKPVSFIKVGHIFMPVKKALLVPWKIFEEAVRVMGSNQRGIRPVYKLVMHVILAVVPILYLINLSVGTSLYIPMIGSFNLGVFYWIFIAVLIIGFINALGITDGMDGLSAGSHVISFGAYGVLSAFWGNVELAYLSFIIVGAELAFLYFNIKPARMQMSDVGTVPLGILFVLIAVISRSEITLPFIGALFVVEILSSVGQQWSVKLRGKRILKVAPIHHHFEKIGWTENKIVERFWLFTAITSLFGLWLILL